jgi:hypothetical protein
MAAAAVSVGVIAVALAAITALGFGVAAGDAPAENARVQRPPSPTPAPFQADASIEPLARVAPGRHSAPGFPLTFTIPDVMSSELFQHVGWLTSWYDTGGLPLLPDTAENRAWLAGAYPLTLLYVLPDIAVAAEDCSHTAAPGVGLTATDIVGALATRQGMIASAPLPVTIGGLSGHQIDLSVAPDWTRSCEGGPPSVPLLYAPDYIREGAEPGERFRIIVLDLPGPPSGMYATVMIVVYSGDAAVWDDHLSNSMTVVDSFEFDTTPAQIPSGQGGDLGGLHVDSGMHHAFTVE